MYQLVSCADQIDPPKEALRWTVTVGMTVGALARRPGMSIEKHTRRSTGEAQAEAQEEKHRRRSAGLAKELWGARARPPRCCFLFWRKWGFFF